ncbi:MAG: 2-oxoglutarate dehydrogenase E1 component [Chloroflexota bacterium]|nr:MAG: 2-oxoglutarate dehydrogenase E1 component [Chloroflexota bacterium]
MSVFQGVNEGYVLELYERYQKQPDSVDPRTRAFFASWSPEVVENGYSATAHGVSLDTVELTMREIHKAVGAVNFAQAIRLFGHVEAEIDPLGLPRPGDPELSPEFHGISWDDLRNIPASLIGGPIAGSASNAFEAVNQLLQVYCGSIGFDNDHIRIPEERNWLREAAESGRYRFNWSQSLTVPMLNRLTQVEAFEQFLQNTFPTKYRFSIEGLDTMVPLLDEIVRLTATSVTTTIAIAMAHRGRLNVLTHIMGKPYAQILSEFRDALIADEVGYTVGDVKYHKGVQYEIGKNANGVPLIVTMPPNPSHLEFANPVAVGMARAAGTRTNHAGMAKFDHELTLQVLIHGDAAFPGQGIVAETFNLSLLPGFWTGGTIHVIANNQLGFTTSPVDGRSTLYASDLAKGFKTPVMHVNADDPAAVLETARIAYAYHQRFGKDILIDLVGYRRHGHNEMDEPNYTHPLMYRIVREKKSVRQVWADRLIEKGHITATTASSMYDEYIAHLTEINETLPPPEELMPERAPEPPRGAAAAVITAVPMLALKAINEGLANIPETFNFTSARFKGTIAKRRDAFNAVDEPHVDWATAEELAFATILADGTPVRLTGQDSERATFSQRHAVLRDVKTGEKWVPLHHFPQARATFEVYNSPLSEAAVLGFEYGYSVQEPSRLVLWEAQYGDFANGAQVIIDQFIMSGREKWGQTPSLVLLLPHGHEGAGPDHSSARLERFLQMAAKINSRIAYPTTAAQYFHLLRRQALLLETDPLPLIIMAPKSLLRKEAVFSPARALAEGRWQPVLPDTDADPAAVTRLVLCSGKFYYDLVESEHRTKHPETAVARVEQLYPLPVRELRAVVESYPNLTQIVWAQEEPKNSGAWEYIGWRLRKLVEGKIPVDYVGRRRSGSAAEGSKNAHIKNQSLIVDYAFSWQFGK